MIEAGANYGCYIGNCACIRVELVEPRHDGLTHGPGQVQLRHIPAEPLSVRSLVEASRCDERVQRLTDEEDVAACPAIEQCAEFPAYATFNVEGAGDEVCGFVTCEGAYAVKS